MLCHDDVLVVLVIAVDLVMPAAIVAQLVAAQLIVAAHALVARFDGNGCRFWDDFCLHGIN